MGMQRQQQQRPQGVQRAEAQGRHVAAPVVKEAPPSPDKDSIAISSDPHTLIVQKRLRKFSKKVEAINEAKEEMKDGPLTKDQKALLAEEAEVLVVTEELNSLMAQLLKQHAGNGEEQQAAESPLVHVQKRIRKFHKKVEKIDAIKEKQREGHVVNEDQKKVLATESEVQAVLAELSSLQTQLSTEEPPSPDAKESEEEVASEHGANHTVQKRIQKLSKKAEIIEATKDKQMQGGSLSGDQKALLKQEAEVLAIIEELNSLMAQLNEQTVEGEQTELASVQVQKRIRKFAKKVQKIDQIKEKKKEGAVVNEDQKKVLASEPEVQAVLAELSELQEQLAAEEAAVGA